MDKRRKIAVAATVAAVVFGGPGRSRQHTPPRRRPRVVPRRWAHPNPATDPTRPKHRICPGPATDPADSGDRSSVGSPAPFSLVR
jgi:hypothetical protein